MIRLFGVFGCRTRLTQSKIYRYYRWHTILLCIWWMRASVAASTIFIYEYSWRITSLSVCSMPHLLNYKRQCSTRIIIIQFSWNKTHANKTHTDICLFFHFMFPLDHNLFFSSFQYEWIFSYAFSTINRVSSNLLFGKSFTSHVFHFVFVKFRNDFRLCTHKVKHSNAYILCWSNQILVVFFLMSYLTPCSRAKRIELSVSSFQIYFGIINSASGQARNHVLKPNPRSENR